MARGYYGFLVVILYSWRPTSNGNSLFCASELDARPTHRHWLYRAFTFTNYSGLGRESSYYSNLPSGLRVIPDTSLIQLTLDVIFVRYNRRCIRLCSTRLVYMIRVGFQTVKSARGYHVLTCAMRSSTVEAVLLRFVCQPYRRDINQLHKLTSIHI